MIILYLYFFSKIIELVNSVGEPVLFFTGSRLRLPLKKAWLPAHGSHFLKFLLPALVHSSLTPCSRLLEAVFRSFYLLPNSLWKLVIFIWKYFVLEIFYIRNFCPIIVKCKNNTHSIFQPSFTVGMYIYIIHVIEINENSYRI